MNTKLTIYTFFCFFLFLTGIQQLSACDDSSATLISYTDNQDGTYTTVLEVCNEFNGLEGAPEQFRMTFENAIDIDNFMPMTVTTTSNDPYNGSASGNQLTYSTTSIFPGNSNVMFCNTYTITTSESIPRIIVATHLGRGEADCSNRIVCVEGFTPTMTSTTVDEDSGLLDLTTLQDSNYSTGTWSGPNVTGTNFDPSGLSGDYVLTFTSDELCVNPSTITVTVNALLAVQLSHFEAETKENCEVLLSWTTSAEYQHAYFELEQSQDGLVFQAIAQIEAKGNQQKAAHYQSTVAANDLNNGTYFRLAQVDDMGALTYSEVLKVNKTSCGATLSISSIYPNPIQENANLDINVKTDMQADILIYNVIGTMVQHKNVALNQGKNTISIDLNSLLSGVYFVKILGEDASSSIGQLIKQ